MTTNATTTLLQSVRRQFEQFQQRHASMPGLVCLQPGAGVSFADALEQCPLTAGVFPNGRPTGAALPTSGRDDDGQPIELFLALPTDKAVNGAFASLAKEAGDCISDAATAAGVPDFVLSEEKPTFRWLRVLYWFALEQPGFPGQTKWYLLNLIDESAGRYAHIRDAVRCSIYVLDWLASGVSTSLAATPAAQIAGKSQPIVTVDPNDDRVVYVCGKRVVLGRNTQTARLFCLLGDPIGVERTLAEVQFTIDGFETGREFGQSAVEIRRAHGRVRKTMHTLRQRLKEFGADRYIQIEHAGTGMASTYRMVRLFVDDPEKI